MDARMGQVYWAAFECSAGLPEPLTPERLSSPGEVLPPGGTGWFAAGHGFAAYGAIADRLGRAIAGIDAAALPRARDIAGIAAADLAAGRGLEPARGLPVYLRDDVVHRR
jgi:tRNA threonylcarbamoyladenosine biosynthesis protein TsaB